MLIKSIKHDIMATYRDFFGIYVALLVAAILGPFVLQTGNNIVNSIAVMTIMGLSLATLVITVLTIINLYNRRMFSNEGYLTLTLPVKTHITIIAKIITGMIWSAMTLLVFFVSALFFVLLYSFFRVDNAFEFFGMLKVIMDALLKWSIIKIFLIQLPLVFVSGIQDLVLLVFIMTFVNTSFIKKGKLPIGVAAYMILGSLISALISTLLIRTFGAPIVYGNLQNSIIINQLRLDYSINFMSYTAQLILIASVIAGLGYASWWLLEHKLEIE